ncbi:hypothetical protein BN2497_5775 [Janthinobacterium sp. CG23_2]|nr:hypothetical protein BN2497_5775 [Janthinobacterium sp. CG23_2]CUU29285.1 hypothetical protein BN3177_5775 [Janthinobacterium sp. CG23_2]
MKAPVLKALFARVSFSDYLIGANFTAFCASFAMAISRKIPCAMGMGARKSGFSRIGFYVKLLDGNIIYICHQVFLI